jgi:hypothetical protein
MYLHHRVRVLAGSIFFTFSSGAGLFVCVSHHSTWSRLLVAYPYAFGSLLYTLGAFCSVLSSAADLQEARSAQHQTPCSASVSQHTKSNQLRQSSNTQSWAGTRALGQAWLPKGTNVPAEIKPALAAVQPCESEQQRTPRAGTWDIFSTPAAAELETEAAAPGADVFWATVGYIGEHLHCVPHL